MELNRRFHDHSHPVRVFSPQKDGSLVRSFSTPHLRRQKLAARGGQNSKPGLMPA